MILTMTFSAQGMPTSRSGS